MKKIDLMEDIQKRTGISKEDTNKIVGTYIKVAKEELEKNNPQASSNLVRGEENET